MTDISNNTQINEDLLFSDANKERSLAMHQFIKRVATKSKKAGGNIIKTDIRDFAIELNEILYEHP